jgi:hypothetical protein
MALRSRLRKLESLNNRVQSDDPNKSRRTLIYTLGGTAAKLTGLEFSRGWCDGASNRELAGAAWLESRTGAYSPGLWQNVLKLSNQSGPKGKLFSALLDQANGG